MKCEKLNYEKLGDMMPLYPRSTLVIRKQFVDGAIAELKAENERLRGESCKLTDGCLRLKQCRKEKVNLADELRATKLAQCGAVILRMMQFVRDEIKG